MSVKTVNYALQVGVPFGTAYGDLATVEGVPLSQIYAGHVGITGSLPPGVAGLWNFAGTPTTAGTYILVYAVKDSGYNVTNYPSTFVSAQTITVIFTVASASVNPPPTPTPSSDQTLNFPMKVGVVPSWIDNNPLYLITNPKTGAKYALNLSGAKYTNSGSLPPGITYISYYATQAWSGTPTQAGTFTYKFIIPAGSVWAAQTITCNFTVAPADSGGGGGSGGGGSGGGGSGGGGGTIPSKTYNFSGTVGIPYTSEVTATTIEVIESYGYVISDCVYTATGSIPPGTNFNSSEFTGTPTASGTFTYTFALPAQIVSGNQIQAQTINCIFTISIAPPQPTGLDWPTARISCESGNKIARFNWTDRFIFFCQYLFLIQFYNPITKQLGIVRVVQAGDFGASEFNAHDWLVYMTDWTQPDNVDNTYRFPLEYYPPNYMLFDDGSIATTESGDRIEVEL